MKEVEERTWSMSGYCLKIVIHASDNTQPDKCPGMLTNQISKSSSWIRLQDNQDGGRVIRHGCIGERKG